MPADSALNPASIDGARALRELAERWADAKVRERAKWHLETPANIGEQHVVGAATRAPRLRRAPGLGYARLAWT